MGKSPQLKLTTMKNCEIIGIGINKNSKPFIRVAYFEGNFRVVKYVEVLSTDEYKVNDMVDVPNACLS